MRNNRINLSFEYRNICDNKTKINSLFKQLKFDACKNNKNKDGKVLISECIYKKNKEDIRRFVSFAMTGEHDNHECERMTPKCCEEFDKK